MQLPGVLTVGPTWDDSPVACPVRVAPTAGSRGDSWRSNGRLRALWSPGADPAHHGATGPPSSSAVRGLVTA